MQQTPETKPATNSSLTYNGHTFNIDEKTSNQYTAAVDSCLQQINTDGVKPVNAIVDVDNWGPEGDAALNKLISSGVQVRLNDPNHKAGLSQVTQDKLAAAKEVRYELNSGEADISANFNDLLQKKLDEKKKQAEKDRAKVVTPPVHTTKTLHESLPSETQKSQKPPTDPERKPTKPTTQSTQTSQETLTNNNTSFLTVEQTKPSNPENITKVFEVEKNAFFKPRAHTIAVDNCLDYIHKDLAKKGVSADSVAVTVHGPWKEGNYAIQKLIKSGVEVKFGKDYKPTPEIEKLHKAAQEVREARSNMVSQGKTPSESFETMLKKKMAEPDKPKSENSVKVSKLPMGKAVQDRVKEKTETPKQEDSKQLKA